MVLKMFTIRDQKSELFHKPFFKTTHGEAERDFTQACNDPQSTIHKFPEDFDLYYLGTYDDNAGSFKPVKTPEHVTKAINCVKTQQLN